MKKRQLSSDFLAPLGQEKMSENECLDGSLTLIGDAEPKLSNIKFFFRISEIEEIR